MPFQVVIAIEALGALITLERSFVVRCLLGRPEHLLLQLSSMTRIVARHQPPRQTMALHSHQAHWVARIVYIGHDRPTNLCWCTHRG